MSLYKVGDVMTLEAGSYGNLHKFKDTEEYFFTSCSSYFPEPISIIISDIKKDHKIECIEGNLYVAKHPHYPSSYLYVNPDRVIKIIENE